MLITLSQTDINAEKLQKQAKELIQNGRKVSVARHLSFDASPDLTSCRIELSGPCFDGAQDKEAQAE